MAHYHPTPMIAPWNGSGGFFERSDESVVTHIEVSKDPRLAITEHDATASGLSGNAASPSKMSKRARSITHDITKVISILSQ